MCGIVGKISTIQIDVNQFNLMRDALKHRGPDGFGTTTLNDGRVALGHRRLSIVDLSERGRQPMSNEDGKIWITFNGEIYNFAVLRKELEADGHHFKSDTDTEVLIHGYEQWGIEKLLKKVKGMFAFAIWDEIKQKIFLAKDRFGIKPLYYFISRGEMIFASEIKAIVADKNVPRDLDLLSVFDFFVYRFIPSPKSVWKDIKKLPPASYLIFDTKTEKTTVSSYWSIPVSDERISETTFHKKFRDLLEKSVEEHLLGDVPVGLFLSGGYDSSTLAYLTTQSGYRLSTFSIGFKDWVESEHEYARIVANQLNAFHHEEILDAESLNVVSSLSYYYDEPLGGSSFLPTYLVSKLVRDNNVKVVLAGDGGDELLGGYKWHTEIMSELRNRNWLARIIKNDHTYLLERYFQKMSWAGFTYRSINSAFGKPFDEKELPDDLWLYRSLIRKDVHHLKNLQLLDFTGFMPEVILNKVDRASMANSIEVRVPFLDHELVEFVMQTHPDVYYDISSFKKPLFSILKDVFPDSILNKPKKGFGAPVHFFSNSLKENGHPSLSRSHTKYQHNLDGRTDKRKLWAASLYNNWVDQWNS